MSQEQFLEELTSLTIKCQVVVGGYGCCGSPFLSEMDTNKIIAENLKFEGNKYFVPFLNGGDIFE